MSLLGPQIETLQRLQPYEITGTVAAVRGLAVFVDDLPLPVGSLVRFEGPGRNARGAASEHAGEVIGFDGTRSIVMLFGSNRGIAP